MTETRKLAAILVSDVAGYSRLAGADEDRTLARLRTLRSDLIDPIISVHRGRVVKRTGDGSIIEFRSVVDAVRCAIEVQTGMVERNMGLPPEKRIEFRVGVHLGDVVEESDGDLMGDGVNIAARLESIAKPGAICLSEDAYRQVKQRLDLKVADLGAIQLKNIAEPVRVYALEVGQPAEAKTAPLSIATVEPESGTPGPRASQWSSRWPALGAAIAALLLLAAAGGWALLGGRPTKPAEAAHLSIVVLPFTNLSGDPSQDYFADGVTENLTTELSRIKDSFVIARNTAFTYKGKSVDAKEIGKELGVRYVLEGSVQRDQNRVRVNAQLIDAESGAHLWADRFEEDIADLFKLQDQVVARLANTLGYELIKAEAQRDERITHPDALDLTMRGRTLEMRYAQEPTREHTNEVRAMYERALAIDPNDASALAGEANTYLVDRAYGWADPDVDYDAKIVGQADRSIAISPDDPRPYFVKSVYLTNSNHPVEGLRAADAGLSVNPNIANLHAARGLADNYLGRFEQGISEVGQAMRLSPRDPFIGNWHSFAAEAKLGLGHFDAAIEEANKAIDAGYRVFLSYSMLAVAYALNGNLEQAKTALAEARRLNPKLTVKLMQERYPDFPWMSEGLRKAGLQEE
jgi:adenylate cyclase